jgi:hypothetical protein
MKRFLIAATIGVLCVGVAVAQEPAAQAAGSSSQSAAGSMNTRTGQVNSQASGQAAASAAGIAGAQVAQGTTIQAVLAKPVDSRKSKVGDEVVARATQDVKSNGQVIISKGTRLLGHVTEAKARTKGESASALGIAFDTAVLKDGRGLSLPLSIQALAVTQARASTEMEGDTTRLSPAVGGGGHASGGMLAGATGPVGAVAGTATNTLGTAGTAAGGVYSATEGMTTSGVLTSSAHGVVGLPGLSLTANESSSAQGSVITSQNQNVHLESGTQMVLRVNAQ